jgi:hypothetical protein
VAGIKRQLDRNPASVAVAQMLCRLASSTTTRQRALCEVSLLKSREWRRKCIKLTVYSRTACGKAGSTARRAATRSSWSAASFIRAFSRSASLCRGRNRLQQSPGRPIRCVYDRVTARCPHYGRTGSSPLQPACAITESIDATEKREARETRISANFRMPPPSCQDSGAGHDVQQEAVAGAGRRLSR